MKAQHFCQHFILFYLPNKYNLFLIIKVRNVREYLLKNTCKYEKAGDTCLLIFIKRTLRVLLLNNIILIKYADSLFSFLHMMHFSFGGLDLLTADELHLSKRNDSLNACLFIKISNKHFCIQY